MLYKALGFVIWKLAMRRLRQQFGSYRKPAAALIVAAAITAIYVATRGDDE
jgi:hypothetical protein